MTAQHFYAFNYGYNNYNGYTPNEVNLGDYKKLFKTPLQFRLARTSNCHAGQIAVTSLLKGTFEELPIYNHLLPWVSTLTSMDILIATTVYESLNTKK